MQCLSINYSNEPSTSRRIKITKGIWKQHLDSVRSRRLSPGLARNPNGPFYWTYTRIWCSPFFLGNRGTLWAWLKIDWKRRRRDTKGGWIDPWQINSTVSRPMVLRTNCSYTNSSSQTKQNNVNLCMLSAHFGGAKKSDENRVAPGHARAKEKQLCTSRKLLLCPRDSATDALLFRSTSTGRKFVDRSTLLMISNWSGPLLHNQLYTNEKFCESLWIDCSNTR